MSHRTLLSCLRALRALIQAGVTTGLLLIGGCTGQGPTPPPLAGSSGELFARSLDDIKELYVEPVSLRWVALSGMSWLKRLDNGLTVGDGFGSRSGDALTLAYDGRDINHYAVPADGDWQGWGQLINAVVATAKQVSPRLAALPEDQIDRAVLYGMTAALDGFSRYAGPETAGEDRAERDGFGGVGVTLDASDHQLRVAAVSPHSPADIAGLHPEDQIVAINGVATAGSSEEEAIHQLRGPVGSAVALRVQRPGNMETHDVQLRRELVTMPTVTMSRAGDIAVLHVTSFNRLTARHAAEALAEARQQTGGRIAGIVLDLRGNPGGLLDQAVDLAELFIDEGPIVSTVGRHPASYQNFVTAGRAIAAQLPVAVLINGGSASASEIVAAALQDAGRAVVIGSSSYGKGTVQTVLPLPNNGELILTWARLVARSGYLLQHHGVVPTMCTASLIDDASDPAVQLQKAAAVAFAGAQRPRAELDEQAWSKLRQTCPPLHTRPAIDLILAERLLANPTLYVEALRALPAALPRSRNTPLRVRPP